MSITIVNDWKFKEGGNVAKGLTAAAELVEYFKAHEPQVRLSLWLKDRNDPLRFFHITVFDTYEAFQRICQSEGIKRFVEQFYPEIDQSTHVAPECDVVLSSGATLDPVTLP